MSEEARIKGEMSLRRFGAMAGLSLAVVVGTGSPPSLTVAGTAAEGAAPRRALGRAVSATVFADVPEGHPFQVFVERLYELGVTAGCATDPLRYCPDDPVTRAQMSVFLLRARYGPSYTPPPASGAVFVDVPVSNPFAPWVERLAAEGITAGCGVDPPRFCPDDPVTRAQMSVFLLRARYGSGYDAPPTAVATFADVPATDPFFRWVEQLARERITAGCEVDPPRFCPDQPVTRGQMAVFLGVNFYLLPAAREWHQHGHDEQRTSFTEQVVPHPWQWLWAWNGPDSSGGVAKVTSNGSLPRNVQPVTGGGRVYVAAGADGVFALSELSGAVLWQQAGIGDVRSTVAFDPDTQMVMAFSTGGVLYRLRADDGTVVGQFASGQPSPLPLPPALVDDRVLFVAGTKLFALNKVSLAPVWTYEGEATVVTPPAYSRSRDLVVIATEPDLNVHGVRNSTGERVWRRRPVHPDLGVGDPTEFRLGWPVVADNTGVVLVKVRLRWQSIWREWPQTNEGMRQLLATYPQDQALFALRLDDGTVPYVVNVGHGGYGDTDYLPMGPQPVVKRLVHGREVGYTIIRARHAYDARWDSHFGELVLDAQTVPGYEGGDVRFIAFDWPPGAENPFLLTDEQPNPAMAGDDLFGGHWEAGFAMRILDRSPARGTFAQKITSQRLATVVTSQDAPGLCAFSPSHFCPSGLVNTREYDSGFYIYYGQGSVYDQYWSEYATTVVSNGRVYFRSCDGAIVALGPASGSAAPPAEPFVIPPRDSTLKPVARPPAVIDPTQARAFAGRAVTVRGVVSYLANNGKHQLVAFARPHQGSYKAIIPKSAWSAFTVPVDQVCSPGRLARITGVIGWYQGDPVTYVTRPDQLQCTHELFKEVPRVR
mgnify:CR=1 FL=1